MKKLLLSAFIMINLLTGCSADSDYNEVETYNDKDVLNKKAAVLQDAAAQFALGANYYFGYNGYTQDYSQAKKWFEASAKQGHASAQYNLGLMYLKGKVIPKDLNKAKLWLEKASNQGHLEAQVGLAGIYLTTNNKNSPKGLELLKQALKSNSPQAQLVMGVLYYNGTAVSQDTNEAKRYFDMACKNGLQKGCELSKDIQ